MQYTLIPPPQNPSYVLPHLPCVPLLIEHSKFVFVFFLRKSIQSFLTPYLLLFHHHTYWHMSLLVCPLHYYIICQITILLLPRQSLKPLKQQISLVVDLYGIETIVNLFLHTKSHVVRATIPARKHRNLPHTVVIVLLKPPCY